MHDVKDQKTLFYRAMSDAAIRDADFSWLVTHPTNPLTREDLEANIARRPSLWSRYAGFLDKLPRRADLARPQ